MNTREEKKTRKGGRSARRSLRLNAPVVHHPALISKIPIYEVANQEGVDQIHEMAMQIIEEIDFSFFKMQQHRLSSRPSNGPLRVSMTSNTSVLDG